MECVDSTEDPLMRIVRMHQNNTKSATGQTDRQTDRQTDMHAGRQKSQDRTAERNKTDKGEHSRQEKIKVAGEKHAWKMST
jgi:Ni/Co efflux regulator RcnB